ncbi:hypothetical protein MMB232_03119 [Brevundimonas subvibrioides]|uniref:DUF6891 domain-containing protein n=1 Tax=Brevundimonas subvibrioides TaxID=74313 RepID=UPI0032D5754E
MQGSWLRTLFGIGRARDATPPPVAANASDADVLAQLRQRIETDVAAGFAPDDEIVEGAVDYLAGEMDADVMRAAAPVLLAEALAAHRRAQAEWPEITDCDRLDAAFAALEADGVIARQNFSCCGSCGSHEIWDEIDQARDAGRPAHGYAFYHMQDTDAAVEGHGLYLGYGAEDGHPGGAVAVGHAIVSRLGEQGLATDCDGRVEKRIGVTLDWKRRR